MNWMKVVLLSGLVGAAVVTAAFGQAGGHGAGRGSVPIRVMNKVMTKVMILDGQSGGAYHNWRLTTPVLKRELEETGLFSVTVVTAPASDGDFSGFKPEFGNYQAIVMNYDGPDWPADLRTRFEQYVSGGGGLVIVHAADNAFPNWAAYNEMAGIGGWRNRTENAGPYWYVKDGKLVSDPSPGPAGQHGARLPFQVETQDAEHPIMKGLPAVWMHFPDEFMACCADRGRT